MYHNFFRKLREISWSDDLRTRLGWTQITYFFAAPPGRRPNQSVQECLSGAGEMAERDTAQSNSTRLTLNVRYGLTRVTFKLKISWSHYTGLDALSVNKNNTKNKFTKQNKKKKEESSLQGTLSEDAFREFYYCVWEHSMLPTAHACRRHQPK